MKHRRLIRALLLIAIGAVAVMIFLFSAQTGEESQATSDQLTEAVARVVVRDFDKLTPAQRQPHLNRLGLSIRKLAHFSEFALLSALLALFFHLGGHRPLLPAWGIATLYACTDEAHQMFVAGRGPSPIDVGIDSLGALAAAGLVALIAARRRRKR